METDWRLCPSLSISKLIHLNLTLRDVRWSLKVTPVRRPLDWAGVPDTNYHFVLHPENNVNNRLTDTMDGFVLQCTHRHSTDCYVDTRLFHLHQSNVHFQTPSNVCHFDEYLFQVRIPARVSEACLVEHGARAYITVVIWLLHLLQSQSLFTSSYFTCHILDSCNIIPYCQHNEKMETFIKKKVAKCLRLIHWMGDWFTKDCGCDQIVHVINKSENCWIDCVILMSKVWMILLLNF